MKNKIFTAFIVITIFLVGTAWIHGMVKADQDAKNRVMTHEECVEYQVQQEEAVFETIEPNLANWTINWPTSVTAADYTIATDSGHEFVLNTDGDDFNIIGDPNYYGEALKTMLKCYIQQQESHEFWQKTNQKLLTDTLDLAMEVVEETKKLLNAKCQHKEQIIEIASEIAFDVVMEVGENIKSELAVTE